ncbi:MAG: FAD-binding protein, partial [Burkholderiales bacterium]|nr:FAD-binding protein [Phycisphaerae bacterium]
MPSLPVLPNSIAADDQVMAGELRRLIRGQVRFGEHDRMLYATDASIYQVKPLGVVVPADEVDVRNLLRWCDRRRVPVLGRGGGTSLAGQCVNAAIVCDLSQMCREVISFDPAARTLHVQPGISIDQVNRWLAGGDSNLFFAPDPATAAQCAIGGAIGNNAAGARSLRYGRTSENLAGVEIVLPGGEKTWLDPGAGRRCPIALRLAREVVALAAHYDDEIRARFPKLNRRNAGYGIDLILHQLDAGVPEEDLDLSGLICGSEGTLGVIVSAKLKLHPLPRAKGLAIISFPTLEESIDSVIGILATGAIAVELLDEEVLTAAAGNNVCREYLDLLPPIGAEVPKAVLYVEYQNESDDDAIARGFQQLRALMVGRPMNLFMDAASMARAWALRKAGEPLLHGLGAHRKPLTFVEDNSIPVKNLSRFVREFKRIVGEHGTRAAYWAHVSVGVLHVRPMLDLHDAGDRDRMISIAQQIADLARDCGGVMSGEHGDGRARGPLLERFYGPAIMECFRQIKCVFDPNSILNPGMIVSAGEIGSIAENLRTDPVKVPEIETFFNYADQEGFAGAVEMCNGAGVCRKTAGGTMCPSYRGLLDERHSTRGRGNALRLAISGQLRRDDSGKPDFADQETIQTLDLCLSCKACRSECPSNVDIARLKAEYTAQRYHTQGTPLHARLFGHIRRLNQIGSAMPGASNWLAEQPLLRRFVNKTLGLAAQRSLPRYDRSLYSRFQRRVATNNQRPKVVLFGDCFMTYNEPRIGIAAIRVLGALGYEVVLPRVGCCGRAMISVGLLEEAITTADRTLRQLKAFVDDPEVRGILVAEPSCLASFKDDWLTLKLKTPLAERTALADKAYLIEDFVERNWDSHPNRPSIRKSAGGAVILHGHCHQKALWGDATSSAILSRMVGNRLHVLPSGCCGMAGSFGYMAHRYELSMKIGALSVFPPISAASP